MGQDIWERVVLGHKRGLLLRSNALSSSAAAVSSSMSSGLVAWCCDYPWYAAAAVFLVVNLLLLIDVGQDIPLLFPLRWLFSGPHRSTPEYARLKSKYLLRR